MKITLDSLVERLLALILTPDSRLKASISLFVGAGVSREYGVPTSYEFAKLFFDDPMSSVDEEAKLEFDSLPARKKVETFIKEFRGRLNSQLAYAFFKKVEHEALSQAKGSDSITYDRLADLWKAGFINLVVTTNFDSLIERAVDGKLTSDSDTFRVTVLDYNDLERVNRPENIDPPVLVKLAGDIGRSNMLWTRDDFENNLTDRVIHWLSSRLEDDPLVLLGYAAAESPVLRLLANHPSYLGSVDLKAQEEVPSLSRLAEVRNRSSTDHARGSAAEFLERLYNSLYARTKDPNLRLSLEYLKDRVKSINQERLIESEPTYVVDRRNLRKHLSDFALSDSSSERLTLVLGDAGHGKTMLVKKLADSLLSLPNTVAIYVPGSELLRSSLEEWSQRLAPYPESLRSLCALSETLGAKLLLILDGLNEIPRAENSKAILNELLGMLDGFRTGSFRCIVTSRSDYWRRLNFRIDRTYLAQTLRIPAFDDLELENALVQLNAEEIATFRNRSVFELLRVPENFGLMTGLGLAETTAYSEVQIYQRVLEERLGTNAEAAATLIWLCHEQATQKSLSCNLIDIGAEDRVRSQILALASSGLLSLSQFDTVRFSRDRVGEYIFGALYLYEYRWKELSTSSVADFFEDTMSEYQSLSEDHLDYKIHFLSGLIAFATKCSDSELELLYGQGNGFSRTLIRAAVVLRRGVSIREPWKEDALMLGAAFLRRSNYSELKKTIFTSDQRFFMDLPFSFVAKLYPESLLDFIEYLLELAEEQQVPLENHRKWMSVLVNSILIFTLRNGPEKLAARGEVSRRIAYFVRRTKRNFLASRIDEALHENSRFLFHWNRVDKFEDLYELEPYWKDQLRAAIGGSLFDLRHRDIDGLIRLHASSRLVLKFLFCRDSADNRLKAWLEHVFTKSDPQIHDFAMGVLGWAGKLDEAWIPVAEHYLAILRDNYSSNFYRRTLTSLEDEETSQYDPLVPHVTTLLMKGIRVDIRALFPDLHPELGFRIGRLAEKTLLDFPSETLEYLYDAIDEFGERPEMQAPLRLAAKLSPLTFWRHASKRMPSHLFHISASSYDEERRIIGQVRDFDWWQVLNSSIKTAERRSELSRWLLRLLDAPTTTNFVSQILAELTK